MKGVNLRKYYIIYIIIFAVILVCDIFFKILNNEIRKYLTFFALFVFVVTTIVAREKKK